MSLWDDVREAIDKGDANAVASFVANADEDARKTVAKELPGHLKSLRLNGAGHQILPLRVAGAACIPGAAGVASWLTRRDLRVFWLQRTTLLTHVLLVTRLLARRPEGWQADAGRRIAARLRVTDQLRWSRDEANWRIAAVLTRSAGAPTPRAEGFVIGWLQSTEPGELAADPFLDDLLPSLFEITAAGRALEGRDDWARALCGLAEAGRVDRAVLLDGCVRRFLLGGELRDLRWYADLYQALATTGEEAAARVRDHLRLLPAAPGRVAELAFAEVRRTPGLDDADLADAAGALLFRPEKKLVRAALGWLDRSARTRPDAALSALLPAFGLEALDLRERAAAIAAKHAARAGEAVQEALREATAPVPATAPAPVAPSWTPPAAVQPIASLAELEAELMVSLHDYEQEAAVLERTLSGLVEFAFHERAETIETLRRIVSGTQRWWLDYTWPGIAARSLLFPGTAEARAAYFSRSSVPPNVFLYRRYTEIVGLVGKVPVLLATPTRASGHIDPDVLAARRKRYEQAGVEPGPADLEQALLRLPRDAAGIVPDPAVVCTPYKGAIRARITPAGDAGGPLFTTQPMWLRIDFAGPVDGWAALLPSHREVIAAHLLPWLPHWFDEANGQGGVLLALAEADGPVGPALNSALAHGLNTREARERSGAVDALLTLRARDQLDGGDLGTALAALAGTGELKVNRIASGLGDAARSGAPAEVFAAAAGLLPVLWPAPGERVATGLPDLIAVAAETAETTGARAGIPGLADVAGRGGASRLVREAARLNGLLNGERR
ncbi:DUF6493 family protein [Actinomadura macrotermitis]|uniref:DUF7824 domain-containing protein n=1 Tax=Actinomadura macrotermitis TaxID=2585200 RepID=A0A7K0C2X7_9ACTN|nr:DUF6493 family protein [Actinomadura macrotermitis]MQY07785.1 hypothetical protein [Actinomadura macrotermitis]